MVRNAFTVFVCEYSAIVMFTRMHTYSQANTRWDEYIRPLIDIAVPRKLLDFVDFHAYNFNLAPEV